MNKRLTALAVAGTIGLGAVGAVTIPALAASNTPTPSPSGSAAPAPAAPDPAARQAQRETAIKDALKGLVDDKTLTQAQADKVAQKLAETKGGFGGPGGPGGWAGGGPMGGHLGGFGASFKALEDAAAKALGLSTDDLRTRLRSGSTLADIAKKQNKAVATLESTLTQAARTQLSQAVKDKKLTQAQADTVDKGLAAQVKSFVENGRPSFQMRGGMGGPGKNWGGYEQRQRLDNGTPPSAPNPSSSAQTSSFVA